MPIESRRAVERGRRDRSKKRQKERKEEEEEEEEEATHIFIPTHPALKHFQQKFSRKTPNILNKTLLIVTRKGGGNIRQG